MFVKKLCAVGVLGLSCLSAANAAEGAYFGMGFADLNGTIDDFSEEVDLQSLYGRVGYTINDYFSGEFRIGTGATNEHIDVAVAQNDGYVIRPLNVDLEKFYGLYARAGYPVHEMIFPYVTLGYTRAELRLSGLGMTESDSDNDFSYGVGVDFNVTEGAAINLEYTNYYDKDGLELSGVSVGFAFNFN